MANSEKRDGTYCQNGNCGKFMGRAIEPDQIVWFENLSFNICNNCHIEFLRQSEKQDNKPT